MKNPRPIVITKHDGTLERFSLTKLTNCLAAALRRHAYDPRLSGPLARAVAMHLHEWRQARPATTDYIHDCVRAVLQQTGLGEVAADLAAQRRRRRSLRAQISVRADEPAAPADRPWSKAPLVATLENRYGVRHAVARYLAGRIEQKVFTLGYRLVTPAFLRELTRNELLAWGLADERILTANGATLRSPARARQPTEED